jgi:spermidine synthase
VIREPLGPGLLREWETGEVLHDGRTAYQHVVITRTAQGVTLFCDDDRQSSEFSQLTYHEALLVPGLLLAAKLDRVLIVGSSEGVVSQLCAAAGAGVVDHVDIDAEAVRLCAEHLPYGYTPAELATAELAGSAGSGVVRVHYADGWEFVRTARDYDLIVVDLPDERDSADQHNRLYGTGFLRLCRAALAPGGVVAGQAGCPTMWRNETLIRSLRRWREVFATVACYSSDEHEWSFLTARADVVVDPTTHVCDRLPGLPYRPRTLDGEALASRTVLPFHVRRALAP